MWRKDFTGKIHTTFSPLRLTDIARYVKRTDRIPHISIGSCGVPPAPPYDLPTVGTKKGARQPRSQGLVSPHKKRYARMVCRRMKSVMPAWSACHRVKRALCTRAPHWFAVACSECAAAARPFLPIAAPPLDTRPYFFTQAAKTVQKRFTNARACDIMLWQFGDMAQLVERCVRNA